MKGKRRIAISALEGMFAGRAKNEIAVAAPV
jgi:hypothetical protein